MQFGKYNISRNNLVDIFTAKFYGMNSKAYWNSRFNRNWIENNGRIQTALFASSLNKIELDFQPTSILDYGCGTGDSAPFLKLKFGTDVRIFLYDFSERAREHQKVYSKHAKILECIPSNMKFDMVYCSNVIEHIVDLNVFLEEISKIEGELVVIQAPFDERHNDGTLITHDRRKGEHVRTVNLETLNMLPKTYVWRFEVLEVPFAWDYGEQIFFIGNKKGGGRYL